MKVLITGGAGFIGSHLGLKLQEKGYEVVLLDNLAEQIHGSSPLTTSPLYQSIYNRIELIHGDICNRSDVERALKNVEIVVHFAAETGTGQSMYEIERYSNVNIGGTAVLLQAISSKKFNVNKVVVASSRAIYGEGKYYSKSLGVVYPENRKYEHLINGDFSVKGEIESDFLQVMATDENSKLHPSSVYGITKQTQEQLVMCICQALKIPSVSLRYQNVYGPGQSLTNPYTGILSIFSAQMLRDSDINVYEDGTESRDFVYIDDVVDATILAIEKQEANNNIFNVGTGVPIDVKTVAETLKQLYNKDVKIFISGDFRIGDIRHNYADISQMKSMLDFAPNVTFASGVVHFANWVKENMSV